MSVLHIFNPETDYALANNRVQYTPPAKVAELRRKLASLPAIWADRDDTILLLDELYDSSWYQLALQREINVVSIKELPYIDGVLPWGWNRSLAHLLRKNGVVGVPNNDRLENIRNLAHRRNTILFHTSENAPREFSNVQDVINWCSDNPNGYLKAPWSSSGRGVVNASKMSAMSLSGWVAGIIKQQGSVMAEKCWLRTINFATEWQCVDNKVVFKGFSVFNTTDDGRYIGNLSASNEDLLDYICRYADLNDTILDTQKELLQKYFAPFYDGPVGIDMLADNRHRVNPCVEVNLRRTMGMVSASLFRLTGKKQIWSPLSEEIL